MWSMKGLLVDDEFPSENPEDLPEWATTVCGECADSRGQKRGECEDSDCYMIAVQPPDLGTEAQLREALRQHTMDRRW